MLKKLLVLGMAATMLTCVGCGNVEHEETNGNTIIEETIETSEELVDDIYTAVGMAYSEAIDEIFGENIDESQISYTNDTVYYGDKVVSWEYFEEVAYNSMCNTL